MVIQFYNLINFCECKLLLYNHFISPPLKTLASMVALRTAAALRFLSRGKARGISGEGRELGEGCKQASENKGKAVPGVRNLPVEQVQMHGRGGQVSRFQKSIQLHPA